MHRYAIYYAPPRAHPLWRAGCAILGHDPETGEAIDQPRLDGFEPARVTAMTAEARRYGWHATLKSPFALADGTSRAELEAELARFASDREAFAIPALRLACFSGYTVLVPAEPVAALDALAADCVRVFDRFRAPPSEEELARRRRRGLTSEEEENLQRWGYPRVMRLFEFHMTLTEKLGAEEHARAVAALSGLLREALAAPLPVDGITLYGEAEKDGPFALLARYRFGR
ncbi:DUF1045 domain-containing protein [Elioraea rosea]|uniref:DUF1045 domain-containing protein n=1 Tax=Elioraea rosea TaxID=2492390 RepID=UPI00118670AC|nr:DUF1045 domain-containing protein [Elioraea rosea]